MRTTIDAGGRVVIPKHMRERLGLRPGSEVEVAEADGRVEISPAQAPIEVVEVDGRLVARGDGLPPLTDETVRETIERTRR
jgi:AbrB family looped-hinge helix DNA binding protein